MNLKQRLHHYASQQLEKSPLLSGIWHKIPTEIWYFNRRSVAGGAAIGIFCAFIPLPIQLPGAIIGAWMFRFNLPVAIGFTMITNPITVVPIFFNTYRLGAWILQKPPPSNTDESTFSTFFEQMQETVAPLIVGSLSVGLIAATIVYWVIKLGWRAHVMQLWQKRQSGTKTPAETPCSNERNKEQK